MVPCMHAKDRSLQVSMNADIYSLQAEYALEGYHCQSILILSKNCRNNSKKRR